MLKIRWLGLEKFFDNRLLVSIFYPIDVLIYIFRSILPQIYPELRNKEGLYLRLGTTDPYVFFQIFVEEEYNSHLLELFYPTAILDFGAYVGYSSYYFHMKFPEAIIIAVEANVQNFRLLEKSLSKYSKITCLHRAISNVDDQDLLISTGKDGHWGSRILHKNVTEEIKNSSYVKSISLNHIISQHGLNKNGGMMLKCDIEGGELEAFDQTNFDWKVFELIAIETHERDRKGCEESFLKVSEDFPVRDFRGDVTFVRRHSKGH